jgi:hypothetical protein
LDFNVVENGTQISDHSFTTASAAQTFFTNDVLDLGTFTSGPGQVVDINFDLITSASGSGFGGQFLLGTTGGNQPPVTTVPGTQNVQVATLTPINGISVVDGDAVSLARTRRSRSCSATRQARSRTPLLPACRGRAPTT